MLELDEKMESITTLTETYEMNNKIRHYIHQRYGLFDEASVKGKSVEEPD